METLGNISSIESMGLVDGPGIRYVVFLQGCFLRCKYCHNPETWDINKNCIEITPSKLIRKIKRYKNYFGEDGGVTFSGGEPLLQPQFLLECLKLCKKEGINTALDTSGVGFGDYNEILKYTDLVILDIKAVDEKEYKALTGQKIDAFNKFLAACQENNSTLWIRQVIVPGMNDNEDNIKKLALYVSQIKNVEKVELLPYKTFGVYKYKDLNIKYRLDKIPEMDEKKCKILERKLIDFLKNSAQKNNLR